MFLSQKQGRIRTGGGGAWLQGTFNTCKFFFDFWSFRKFQFYSGESSSFVVWLSVVTMTQYMGKEMAEETNIDWRGLVSSEIRKLLESYFTAKNV